MKAPAARSARQSGPALRLAVVGGGRACRSFLEAVRKPAISRLKVDVRAVCDPDPSGEGMRLAAEMGIPTAEDYASVLAAPDLDGILDLTRDPQVFLDLVRRRPQGVWVIDRDLFRFLQERFLSGETLCQDADRQVLLERSMADLLFHQTHEAIILLDPDFKILDANQAYLQAVGRSLKEAVGKRCYETIYGFNSPCSEWQPDLPCPMLETMRTGERAHVIHERIGGDGRRAYATLETYPVKDEEGKVVRVIEIRRDITQELPSRWEMRLEELKTNLGKLVQEDRILSLGKLSASCAHEINNPIQGMLTFGHLMRTILEEKALPEQADLEQFKQYLELMCSELERCGRIVSGLLSFARESSMERKEVDINETLESVITLTRHHMQLQDLTLDLSLSDRPLVIRGDPNQLQQCFLNVIFNAIEATPEGGTIAIRSRAAAEQGRDWAEVSVEDTGCGIAKEALSKIFDPFFTTKPEGKGTGLGLSIVFGVVKGHDGRIGVESEEGRGTRVTLSFPVLNLEEGA